MAFLSTVTDQFTYFATQIGQENWRGKNVLDFGGNVGNILRDRRSTIDHERYWCVDVDREAIDKGEALYPKAHWVFYDRLCFFFNPNGVRDLPLPDFRRKFDFIVAYSVFTNTPHREMIDLVAQLQKQLSRTGALAFTFIEPSYCSWEAGFKRNNFRWRLDLERDRGNISGNQIPKLIEKAKHASWFTLINGSDLYIETDDIEAYGPGLQKTFHVFHTLNHMKKLFPQAIVLPPVNRAMQHCCVIRNWIES